MFCCSSNIHTSFLPGPHRSCLHYFLGFPDIRRSNNHKSVFEHLIIESYLPHNFSDKPRSWTLWIRPRGFSNDNCRIFVGLARLLLCLSEKLFFCSSSTIHTAGWYTIRICSEIAFIVSLLQLSPFERHHFYCFSNKSHFHPCNQTCPLCTACTYFCRPGNFLMAPVGTPQLQVLSFSYSYLIIINS